MSQRGFTLIELMVVMSLTGITSVFFMPAINRKTQDTARTASVTANLRTMQISSISYWDEGAFPLPKPDDTSQPFPTAASDLIPSLATPTQPAATSLGQETSPPPAPPSPMVTATPKTTSSTTPSPSATTSSSTSPTSSATTSTSASASPTSPATTSSSASPTPSATTSSSPSPTSSATTSAPASPTFSAHYETNLGSGNADYSTYLEIKIIPTDLAGKTINGVRVDLGGQGLSVPYHGNTDINLTGYGATTDWSCQLGATTLCQGTTPWQQGVKSKVALFMTGSLANAPSSLRVDLLSNGATTTSITLPRQNP